MSPTPVRPRKKIRFLAFGHALLWCAVCQQILSLAHFCFVQQGARIFEINLVKGKARKIVPTLTRDCALHPTPAINHTTRPRERRQEKIVPTLTRDCTLHPTPAINHTTRPRERRQEKKLFPPSQETVHYILLLQSTIPQDEGKDRFVLFSSYFFILK